MGEDASIALLMQWKAVVTKTSQDKYLLGQKTKRCRVSALQCEQPSLVFKIRLALSYCPVSCKTSKKTVSPISCREEFSSQSWDAHSIQLQDANFLSLYHWIRWVVRHLPVLLFCLLKLVNQVKQGGCRLTNSAACTGNGHRESTYCCPLP